MDRINDASGPNGKFLDADLVAGVQGTIVRALWTNGVQEELVGLIEAVGLVPNASDNTLVRQAIERIGRRTTVFTASGSWIVPPNVSRVRATVIGGGGAGAGTSATTSTTISCAPGGNCGSVGIGTFTVTPGEAIAVTIGAGGVWAAGVGGNGGTSSFGTRLSAPGGHGAGLNPPANPPPLTQAAGPSTFTSVGGDISIPEKQGGFSLGQGTSNFISGSGADSPFGSGGSPVGGSVSQNGGNGYGYGAGGSGGASGPSDTGKAGGYGSGGLILVEY